MHRVEQAARAMLKSHGVDLDGLDVPVGLDESTAWDLALVAEVDGRVVGTARLSELNQELLALDQVSVHPELARQGIGNALLEAVTALARQRGYTSICGTTFRDVIFNAPLYAAMGCVEDPTRIQ